MALIYTDSNIAAGNPLLGATSDQTLSVWGMTLVESNRFLLILARRSDGVMVWKKLDPLTLDPLSYDLPFAPTVANIAANDRSSSAQGQFLAADATYLYYLKGNLLCRRVYLTGADAGSHTLRNTTASALNGATINAMALSSIGLSVCAKADGKIYFYTTAQLTWSNTNINATSQLTEADFANNTIVGAVIQPTSNDLVVFLSGSASYAIKYLPDASARKGSTPVMDSDNRTALSITRVVCAQFRSSVLMVLLSDNTQAGTGIFIYRLGDGSTGVVAKEQTALYFDNDRVKVNSGTVVKLTFHARDGYGEKFSPSDYARFTMLKVGDAYDKDDGALALALIGPFRDGLGFPYNSVLDVPFDSNGEAACYWQSPLELQVDALYHRIHVDYPIVS